MFKFKHTIQIIRWMGLKHKQYNLESWESISIAIKRRMELETELNELMMDDFGLDKSFQLIHVLLKSKETVTKMVEIDELYAAMKE